MPAAKTEADKLTLSTLIQMVFSQLLVQAEGPEQIYIDARENIIGNFFYKLREEFSKDFSALHDMHFNGAGAFYCSKELNGALWILTESETCTRIGDVLALHSWPTTAEFLQRDIRQWFGNNHDKRKSFNRLVKRFEEITKKAS